MDKIFIRDLRVSTIIGTLPQERNIPRQITLNIVLYSDLERAGKSDDLADTVDYQALSEKICEHGEQSSFLLIEKFAAQTAELCLGFSTKIAKVEVTLDKPEAIECAASVAVQIIRERK